jgi:hypothetical protein
MYHLPHQLQQSQQQLHPQRFSSTITNVPTNNLRIHFATET